MTAAAQEGPAGETARLQAEREAVDWLVLLQDDPHEQQFLAAFEDWLAASPGHETAWAGVGLTAALIDAVPLTRHDVGVNWRVDSPRKHERSRLGLRRIRKSAPASWQTAPRAGRALVSGLVAAAACLVLVAGPEAFIRLQADYVSGTGELKTIRLEDGSELRLAPRSAVSLAYNDGRRGVRLLRGQAYFDVRADPARRFVVDAGQVQTTVLGTAFDVVRCGEGATIAVRRGLVQVDKVRGGRAVSERLSAGDRITVTDEGGVVKQKSSEPVGAWTQGDLVIADRSVLDVIEALRPWRAGFILTAGSGLDSKRATGVYDLKNPRAALAALAKVHDLKVREITPWITIVSAD